MGARLFQDTLQQLLYERGWKIPKLVQISGYSRGYLYELANGRTGKTPSLTVLEDLDTALQARGRLVQAWQYNEVDHMQRRELLADAGLLAMVPALTAAETVRHTLAAAFTTTSAPDRWSQVIADYGRSFYLTSGSTLLAQLLADTQVLAGHIADSHSESHRAELTRSAAYLASITALTWGSLGHPHQALRWWGMARSAADHSGDIRTRVFARAWELVNGLYLGRPAEELLTLGAEGAELAGDRADAATAGLWAFLAQTQAVAGHPSAVNSLRRVAEITGRVAADVAADTETIFGWPEVRLRHTESYVYTELGDTSRANAAQDAALALYGGNLAPDRAKVELHRARCLIIDGDVREGIAEAHRVLDNLPAARSGSVRTIAGNVVSSIPRSVARNSGVLALCDRLKTQS